MAERTEHPPGRAARKVTQIHFKIPKAARARSPNTQEFSYKPTIERNLRNPHVLKLKNTLRSDPRVKEGAQGKVERVFTGMKILNFSTHQNVGDAARAGLRAQRDRSVKYRPETHRVSSHLKNLENEEQIKPEERRK